MPHSKTAIATTIGFLAIILLLTPLARNSADELTAEYLLDPTRVVEIRVELPAEDWNALRNQWPKMGGNPEEKDYTYFKGDVWIDGTKIESVGIRKKGFLGSNDTERPSLKIKFDEYEKQSPVIGMDRLTLNNNKQDRSQVSQLLTYRVFRDAGIPAPKTGYAAVTVNGTFLGLYTNVESIKKPFLRDHFANAGGHLYEIQLTDFHPLALNAIEDKGNSKGKNDRAYVRSLAELLAQDGELKLDELDAIIDLDQFIRYWAIESLLGFWDGYAANQNNVYVYFDPDSGKGYFIPWGADWAFTENGPFGRRGNQSSAVYAQSILTNRLYHHPAIPSRYQTAMESILTDTWNEEELLSEIDRVEELVADHLHRFQRGMPDAMNEVRRFIRDRKDNVLSELAQGPARIPAQPKKPAYSVEIGSAVGSFETIYDVPPSESDVKRESKLSLRLRDEEIEVEDLSVSTQKINVPNFGGARRGGRAAFGQRNSEVSSSESILLNIAATSPSGKRYLIAVSVPKENWLTESKPIEVQGSLIETSDDQAQPTNGFGRGNQRRGFGGQGSGRRGFGGPGFGGPGFGGGRGALSVKGSITLSKVSEDQGADIAGSFDLAIIENRGGFGGPGFGGAGFGGPAFGGQGFGGPNFGPPNSRREQSEAGDAPNNPSPGPAQAGPFGFGPAPIGIALQLAIDSNGDGTVSEEEMANAIDSLKKLDTNKDGKLTPDELLPNVPQQLRGPGRDEDSP